MKHIGRKTLFCLLALMLISGLFAYRSVGATGGGSSIVGVKPGDFNEYGYNVTMFSNDTSAMLSTYTDYQWLSTIDKCLVSVENVSGTKITAQFMYTFKNGTTDTITRWADLATNQVSDSEMAHDYFVALNSTNFNETLTRTYLGTNVNANHISGDFINGTLTWPINGTQHTLIYNYTLDLYVNNSTGTLLEYTETMNNKNGTYFSTMTSNVIVVQSSIIPEFPTPLITLTLITATATVLASIIHKRKTRQKRYSHQFQQASSGSLNSARTQ